MPSSKIEQLRERHGDNCWLCTKPLNFDDPNHRKYRTKEHLTPESKGGGEDLENLRLTCGGCNKHLGDRPRESKEKMRLKAHANQAAIATKAKQKKPTSPPQAAAQTAPAMLAGHATTIQADVRHLQSALRKWQFAALTSTGLAFFASGLAVGLLI